MNETSRWLGALLLAAAAASLAPANPNPPCIRQAPDACGQGFYVTDCCGCVYGPYYCVRPCYPPFNGLLPGQAGRPCPGLPPAFSFPQAQQSAVPVFPSHPYARGPRDFFMLD